MMIMEVAMVTTVIWYEPRNYYCYCYCCYCRVRVGLWMMHKQSLARDDRWVRVGRTSQNEVMEMERCASEVRVHCRQHHARCSVLLRMTRDGG